MDGEICYLNTDLDLTSFEDLTALTSAFNLEHVSPLNVILGTDGLWNATFGTEESYSEPEPNIGAMLAVIESFGRRHQSAWKRCTQREFNIGYDCGDEPWAFNHRLSCDLLARIATIGA